MHGSNISTQVGYGALTPSIHTETNKIMKKFLILQMGVKKSVKKLSKIGRC